MADRVLFIAWGTTVRGSEERALEVWNQTLGMYGRMQQEGRIEAFDVVLLNPNSDLDGYIAVRGSAEQLAGVRESEEFQRSMVDASLIVDHLRIVDGYTNEGVAQQIGIYQEAIAKIPQRA